MTDRPRVRIAPLAIANVGLSSGAVEAAGAIAVSLGPDVVLAPAPPPPSAEVIREAIRPRRSLTPLANAVGMVAALAPGALGSRRRAQRDAHATPYGAAAALKAESPQPGPHWQRAAEAAAMGLDACADHHDHMADRREAQRAERKAANRRKAKRGWR